MAKVFGYVELTKQGMEIMGSGSPGPFPIIDLDPHFGVEILDHKRISHWIMKGNYVQMDENTLNQENYEKACRQNRHVHDVQALIKQANELKDVQGQDGNWNYDDYMCGMYNGMELILATLENRDPVYKTLKKDAE